MITGLLALAMIAAARAIALASPRIPVATRLGASEVEVGAIGQDIARQRQEHRPHRRRERGFDGAMDGARQVVQPSHLLRPFYERPGDGGQIGPQQRFGEVEALFVLAGGYQDRRAGLLGVVQHAQGVAEAWRGVQIDHRALAGSLRVAVRHAHRRGFLKSQDVAQILLRRQRVHQRQFRGAGIAEHHAHALLLQ